jgi:hypothetical protein
MASIVFTAINTRSLANWLPVFQELGRRGHRMSSLLFPHRADPDSAGLRDAVTWCRSAGEFPLEESLWGAASNAWDDVVGRAAASLTAITPDAVVMTACHAGPELVIPAVWTGHDERPLFIGCQHGFVQNWDGYWCNFCFDHLLVFGRMFQELAPSRIADRVHIAGLAKLDAIAEEPRPPFVEDRRPILFAGQKTCTDELVALLRSLRAMAGRDVLVRPHPEHRDALRPTGLPLLDHDEPLAAQIGRCSMVVTSGSTVGLEAIAVGAPVAVLPMERGQAYAEAAIVAKGMTAADVLAVVEAQSAVGSRARLRGFLARATGAERGGRVAIGADTVERVVRGKCQGSLS